MSEGAVILRLNLIIVLLLAILAVSLGPLLPSALFGSGLILFVGLLGVLGWGLVRW